MPDEKDIYSDHADQYEELVSREDYQGNIPLEISRRVPLAGKTVIELGAGTGRLTRMLAASARQVWAFDASHSMLQEAARVPSMRRLELAVADNRALPVGDGRADLVISGWSICYLVVWNPGNWNAELRRGLDEMKRMLRAGGSLMILETLGTGVEQPAPPDHLKQYFDSLRAEGFESSWFRTDYRFDSVEQAERLVRFFFGEELADRVVDEHLTELPECTGLWWLDL